MSKTKKKVTKVKAKKHWITPEPQVAPDEPIWNEEFSVHIVNTDGLAMAKLIAQDFNALLNRLKTVCEPGREFAIAKTKLEEACFFAKKAMAKIPANQRSV